MLLNKLLVMLMLFAPLSAFALSTDRYQPVMVEADHVSIDETNEISTYSGNVQYRQGSIIISAQEVVIHTKNQQLDNVIASGNPVKFTQMPDNQKTEVHGRADNVRFYAGSQTLVLSGSAEFSQSDNRFAGPRMEYDLKNNLVHATSDDQKKERVRVVIQPDSLPFARGQ